MIKPCDVKTINDAKKISKFEFIHKQKYGDIRIIEVGYADHVSDPDSEFYFEIWEETMGEGSNNIVLTPKEIEAIIKWWETGKVKSELTTKEAEKIYKANREDEEEDDEEEDDE